MTGWDRQHTFYYTGLEAGLHAKHLVNGPNQKELEWRLGTNDQFFEEMLERLKVTRPDGQLVPSLERLKSLEVDGKLPRNLTALLANLVTDPTTDWAAALLNAWSIVGDILCFYQERLINEGFISTATQPQSLALLNAMLGLDQGPAAISNNRLVGEYRFPGAAGSAQVIATVKGGKGMPGTATIPTNSPLRRVSPSGGGVQLFLVSRDTELRSEWNTLYPATSKSPPLENTSYFPGAGQCFDSIIKSLKPGGLLAVTGQQSGKPAWYLMEISGARTDTTLQKTTITWTERSQSMPGSEPSTQAKGLKAPRFVSLNQSLNAYGSKAPLLSTEPLSRRMNHIASGGIEQWLPDSAHNPSTPTTSYNDGLPSYAVHDFLLSDGGILYLATEKGVFFRTTDASPWTNAGQGLFKRSIQTLVEDTQGFIYAGTVGGGVYRGVTGSTSWSALPGGYIMQPGKLKNGPSLRTSLPATTVNKLALGDRLLPLSAKDKHSQPVPKGLVVAATDNGLYRNDQSGTGWFNIPLSGTSTKKTSNSGAQPQSPVPVLDCALAVHHGHAYIVAITDGALQVLEWPKNIKTPKKPKNKKPDAKAAGHGPAHIPNIFIIAIDGLLKLLKGAWLPIGKLLKTAWLGIVKFVLAIKKMLEWITHVDPQHWSDIDLPYPGSKVTFSGKFISLQFGGYPPKAEASDKPILGNHPHNTFIALSSSAGIFAFNTKTGKFVPWAEGLSKSDIPFAALTSVSNPENHSGAVMLTLLDSKVFGFIPSGGLNNAGVPAGTWQDLLTLPAPTEKPAKIPVFPSIARAGKNSSLYVIQPVDLMTEWPNFAFGDSDGALTQIDVIGLKGVLAPNTVGTLINADNSNMIPFDIVRSETLTRRDFGTHGTVTRLYVSPQAGNFDPQNYDRRKAKILIGNKELFATMPDSGGTEAVSGDKLALAGLIAGLPQRRLSITGAPARALLLPYGGIQAWQFSADTAKQIGPLMLPLRDVTALVRLSTSLICALTPNGVWQTDLSLSWKQCNAGLDEKDKNTKQIAVMTNGNTILLTDTNLYQRSTATDPWVKLARPAGEVPLNFFYEINDEPEQTGAVENPADQQNLGKKTAGTLLLGTSGGGLFQSADGATTWDQILWHGLPGDSYVSAIAQNAQGDVFVGMDGDGLVKADAALTLWQKVTHPSALNNVSFIRVAEKALIVANTDGSLFSLSTKSHECVVVGLSATIGRVPMLDLVIDNNEWTAGLKGGGVIRSTDGGNTWQSFATGTSNLVQALLKLTDNWLVAAAPETLLLDHTNNQQYKPEVFFKIPVSSFVDELDRGLVGPKFLAAFKQAKIKPPKSPCIQKITAGTSWLLCEAPTEKPASKSASSFLIYRDGENLVVRKNGPELPVIAYSESGCAKPQHLSLMMGEGTAAKVDGWPQEVIVRPALKDDPSVSLVETVSAAKIYESQNRTTVTLTSSLQMLFDAKTVSYSANILPLAQGQLVEDEILGDSNPLITFQSFPLKTGQLVFERESDTIVKPVLSVTVNGLAFQQVENFADTGPNERTYVLTLSDKGMATVTFDDCRDSALLAAGTGNIRATYRANMNSFNADDTKAQYIFTEPAYGVSTIATPVSQQAPEPAKLPGTIKKEHTHFPNRLITYADYEVLAEGMPDISKSKLELVKNEGRNTIFLTVAGNDASTLSPDDPTITSTLATISSISIEPKLPVRILPATMRAFLIEATLVLESGLAPGMVDQALSEAYNKLENAFGFTAATIDQSIKLTTVDRLLKTVPLVENVTITGLHFVDKPSASENLMVRTKSTNANYGADLIYLDAAPESAILSAIDNTGKTLANARFPLPKSKGGTV